MFHLICCFLSQRLILFTLLFQSRELSAKEKKRKLGENSGATRFLAGNISKECNSRGDAGENIPAWSEQSPMLRIACFRRSYLLPGSGTWFPKKTSRHGEALPWLPVLFSLLCTPHCFPEFIPRSLRWMP